MRANSYIRLLKRGLSNSIYRSGAWFYVFWVLFLLGLTNVKAVHALNPGAKVR